jgi:hypothetical protein
MHVGHLSNYCLIEEVVEDKHRLGGIKVSHGLPTAA